MHFGKKEDSKPAFETVCRLVDFFHIIEAASNSRWQDSEFSRVKEKYKTDSFFKFYYFYDKLRAESK